jgi:hypothetical protein
MRRVVALVAMICTSGTLWGTCTATKENADYSPVSTTSTATLSTGTGSDGQGHTSAVHAVGDMVDIGVWCYTNCTFPSTMTMGSMTATRTSVVTPGTTQDSGNPTLTTGQAAIYYIQSASASGNQALSITVTNLTSPNQVQLSYIDYTPSASCIFTHHIDSAVGSGNTSGVASTPSVSGVTGDVLFGIIVTTQHVTGNPTSPWVCPTYSGSGETQTCNIDVTQNGQPYILSAASGTIANNWNLINTSTGYESIISTFSMTQLVANACPSAANYRNPANPWGALVTLASFGVTTCYYAATSGLDSNTGADETHPFLYSKGMENCSSNCAAVTLAPDVGFIFRGGDVWHFGNSGATPYAGVVAGCSDNGTISGGLCLDDINASSSHLIYYGVDQTWFSGGSWSQPTLTADNSPCGSGTTGTMPDGATCTGATDSYGQPSYYVSSCPYQVGSANILVDIGFSEYVVFDNFTLTGLCLSHVGQPGGDDTYIRYGSAQAPIYLLDNYIHGASHLHYAALNGSVGCTSSVVCINLNAFDGSVNNGSVGETIAFNAVDFSDSDPGGENLTQGGFYNVGYNYFGYTTQALPTTLHWFHNNLYEYFFENGHSNMIESEDATGTNAIDNNIFRHVETYVSSGGGVLLWPGPVATTDTDHIFNNLIYDVGALEYFNIGGEGITFNDGHYIAYNNLFQSNVAQPILRCDQQSTGTTVDTNNHYIDDETPYVTCASLTKTTSLCQSNTSGGTSATCPTYSDANITPHFDRYTGSETYPYSPVASTNSTVVAGTNKYSAYCGALGTAGFTGAQADCESDVSPGISYNYSTHVVSAPTRTTNARPTSAAWDIGPYQYSAGATQSGSTINGLNVKGMAIQ